MIYVPTLDMRREECLHFNKLTFSLKVEIIRLMFSHNILKRTKLKEELK